jgi:hypothetical protein
MTDRQAKFVIEGITWDGHAFRPGDWIERLHDSLSLYGDDRRRHRLPYRGTDRRRRHLEFLHTEIIDGRKCLVVDIGLREARPAAFRFLMDFVASNRLRIRPCAPGECEIPHESLAAHLASGGG